MKASLPKNDFEELWRVLRLCGAAPSIPGNQLMGNPGENPSL